MPATEPERQPCPACGEMIAVAAVKCRFCGEDVEQFRRRREAAVERDLFVGHPAAIHTCGQWVLVVITLGLAYPFLLLRSLATKYRITTQRIAIERGLLSKTRQVIELFRVDDFELVQPLGMRLLGYGILRIKSSDRDAPEVRLVGIDDVEELYERLREANLRERERRGVKVWTNA